MKAFALTDVGQKRKINQDSVFASAGPVGNLPNLFIVADGMGGHNAGDFASRYAVNTVREAIAASCEQNPVKLIREAIELANQGILDEAARHEEMRGMGTTIVVTTVIGNFAYTANVGDSRVYLIHDGLIQQITDDHTYVNDLVKMGAITKEDAQHHARKNVITRAIGANANNEPDCFSVPVVKGDRVLLCSDGLYDEVDDESILYTVERFQDMMICAEDLISIANENGGNDNISVICINLAED